MKGIICFHAVDSLHAIKPPNDIDFATQHCHFMSPAPNIEILNLYPFVDGGIVFPDIMLCFFATYREHDTHKYDSTACIYLKTPICLNLCSLTMESKPLLLIVNWSCYNRRKFLHLVYLMHLVKETEQFL